MDPTALLLRIRGYLKALDSESLEPHELLDLSTRLRDDVRSLDEWLSKGGFAPQPWQPGRVLQQREHERHISEALAVGNSHTDLDAEIDETFGPDFGR